jgi:hypothetical protein
MGREILDGQVEELAEFVSAMPPHLQVPAELEVYGVTGPAAAAGGEPALPDRGLTAAPAG